MSSYGNQLEIENVTKWVNFLNASGAGVLKALSHKSVCRD